MSRVWGELEATQRLSILRARKIEDWMNDACCGGNTVVTFPEGAMPDGLVCIYMTSREALRMLDLDQWPNKVDEYE